MTTTAPWLTGKPEHISTVPGAPIAIPGRKGRYVGPPDADGICHCDPQPDSSPWGECPTCRKLDARTARRAQ